MASAGGPKRQADDEEHRSRAAEDICGAEAFGEDAGQRNADGMTEE